MRKIFKRPIITKKRIFWLIGLFFIFLVVFILSYYYMIPSFQSSANMKLLGTEAPVLSKGTYSYRDLNKNGKLDVYEDNRQPIEDRVQDLLGQMTLEEKAGIMFMSLIALNDDGGLGEAPKLADPVTLLHLSNSELIAKRKLNHFVLYSPHQPKAIAKWYNEVQKMAERTRLGIPVTVATNVINQAVPYPGSNIFMKEVSHWPFAIGLAATRDTTLVYDYGRMVREEYKAMGIRLALHPFVDIATEPRWARINSTFGEDSELVSQMTRAYIRGFQGDSLDSQSVACTTKHFPGAGTLKDGEDSHFAYGKNQVYPGNNFEYHLIPFKAAIESKTARMMPYYSIPTNTKYSEVGFAFNKGIITDLLRKRLGFDGVVLTDWNILEQDYVYGFIPSDPPRPWGVEELSLLDKTKMVIQAGCDQFGGEDNPELVIELVEKNLVGIKRIDESVKRLLREKFQLGLFDNPYVKPENTEQIVGKKEYVRKGKLAQQKSLVLLKNSKSGKDNFLPLKNGLKLFVENINPEIASKYPNVTSNIEDSDVIFLKLQGPYEERREYLLETFYRQGSLEYSKEEKERIMGLINSKPTIVSVFFDRPAIIPEIAAKSNALIAEFGVEDEMLLDLIFGKFSPEGKLPFEIPSSVEAVNSQMEDLPFDSKDPLFEFGFGLEYRN